MNIPVRPPATNALIEISQLTKRYGRRVALDAVSFDIRAGEIVGLIGPNGAGFVDGAPALEHTLGTDPQPGRRGAPSPELFPANNPVLRPPVGGRVGLWSKTDSTSYFKDFVVSHAR